VSPVLHKATFMINLSGLVLALLFLAGGSHRHIRIDGSHYDAQQRNNMLSNGLEVSAHEAKEVVIPGGLRTGILRRAGLTAGASEHASLSVRASARHTLPSTRPESMYHTSNANYTFGGSAISRRALSSSVSLLSALHLSSALWPAVADEGAIMSSCSFPTLQTLPTVLRNVSILSLGDPKKARAAFEGDPLLADPELLVKVLDSCAADVGAKEDVVKKYDALREEFKYQTSKLYDPRFPDPDDMADLLSCVKKLKSAVERYLESVPATQHT